MYRLKKIDFQGKTIPILCQNENGPCPLLAICNILLLKSKISIHADLGSIDLPHLLDIVANYMIESSSSVLSTSDEALRLQQQAQIEYVIDLLPRLQHGLDINIKFRGVSEFEFTQELSAFDAFNISLLHGWIPDPEYQHTAILIRDLSYNHVILKIVEYQALLDSKEEDQNSESSRRVMEEGPILETFMAETASQLTFAGLSGVMQAMKEHQLAVFFRNNHFSTIFRHRDQLYLLVTDFGYADVPTVVWERLDDVGGDTEYCDSNFVTAAPIQASIDTFVPITDGTITQLEPQRQQPGPVDESDVDYLLALQLHRQELGGEERLTEAAARQLQAQTEQEDADRTFALAMQQEEEEAARQRLAVASGTEVDGPNSGRGDGTGRGQTPRSSDRVVTGVSDMGQALGLAPAPTANSAKTSGGNRAAPVAAPTGKAKSGGSKSNCLVS